ncbi:hypothetical protein OC835_004036 [Tilletia horrida]|nr:hypothetical protein OC835_004036 [Tilletia horrida]
MGPSRSLAKRAKVSDVPASGGLSASWTAALRIVLQICELAPTRPDNVADYAFLRLLPLEVVEEYKRAGAVVGPAHSWLNAIRTVERSHQLTLTRHLQTLIDVCNFLNEHRNVYLSSESPAAVEEKLAGLLSSFQPNIQSLFADRMGPSFTQKVKGTGLHNLAAVGLRLHALCSILGSIAFLPLLTFSDAFQDVHSARALDSGTLTALSTLLRGGRPKMDGLAEKDLQLARAGVFAAHAVFPRILHAYLASLAAAYDRGDISEMATVFHISPVSSGAADTVLSPQPATIRLDANGLARAPISIGLMSGYGANRQPVQTMPAWKLLARYFQLSPDVSSARQSRGPTDCPRLSLMQLAPTCASATRTRWQCCPPTATSSIFLSKTRKCKK